MFDVWRDLLFFDQIEFEKSNRSVEKKNLSMKVSTISSLLEEFKAFLIPWEVYFVEKEKVMKQLKWRAQKARLFFFI